MKLQDKVALITGGGAGLGRESALLFAAEGAAVAIVDVNRNRAEAAAAAVCDQGGRAIPVVADVSREDDVAAAVATTLAAFESLDVLFCNAGVAPAGYRSVQTDGGPPSEPFAETSLEDWNRVIGINLTGVFLFCKHSVAPMRANGGGTIVVTSSAAAFGGIPGLAIYAASKGGVNALVRGLAVDLGADNIRINALCPLWGMSPNFLMDNDAPAVGLSYEEASGRSWDPTAARMPLRSPEPPSLAHNARAALFLACDDSAYMSGVSIPVTDGGSLSRIHTG